MNMNSMTHIQFSSQNFSSSGERREMSHDLISIFYFFRLVCWEKILRKIIFFFVFGCIMKSMKKKNQRLKLVKNLCIFK